MAGRRARWPISKRCMVHSGLSISGALESSAFKLRFSETFINGGTGGLINYSLGLASAGPILTLPLTTSEKVRGETETKASMPGDGAPVVAISSTCSAQVVSPPRAQGSASADD